VVARVKANGMRIALDSAEGDVSFYSHAHLDHTKGIRRAKSILSSRETAHLLGISSFSEGCRWVKLFNAGHVVGARQALIESDGGAVVYTGDFNAKDSLLTKGGEFLEGDILLIDATYAFPGLRFPEPFEVYEEIAKWVKAHRDRPIVFRTYLSGKPQELIRLINEYLGEAPLVGGKILPYSHRYRELGVKLDYQPLEGPLKEGDIAILPRRFPLQAVSSPYIVETTGWAYLYRLKAHRAFPLSDHSDFYDILAYIEESGAKEVYLLHARKGVARLIERHLRYRVRALSKGLEHRQSTLGRL